MGTAERHHHHIVDTGLSLMSHTGLPLRFWNFAFSTMAFLYNRTLSSVLPDEMPYQRVFGQIPNLKGLRVFGAAAYPNLWPIRKNKFLFRLDPHIFVGYPRDYRGYMLYNSWLKKIIISNDVDFFETDFSHDFDSASTHSDLDSPTDSSLWLVQPSAILALPQLRRHQPLGKHWLTLWSLQRSSRLNIQCKREPRMVLGSIIQNIFFTLRHLLWFLQVFRRPSSTHAGRKLCCSSIMHYLPIILGIWLGGHRSRTCSPASESSRINLMLMAHLLRRRRDLLPMECDNMMDLIMTRPSRPLSNQSRFGLY